MVPLHNPDHEQEPQPQMVCPACGRLFQYGQTYCDLDGTRLIPLTDKTDKHQNKKSHSSSKGSLLAVLIGAVVGGLCAVGLLMHAGIIPSPFSGNISAASVTGVSEGKTGNTANTGSSGNGTSNNGGDGGSTTETLPGVYANRTADYSNNLEPGDYIRYHSSSVNGFSFYYPNKLYNSAEIKTSGYVYGDETMLEQVHLSADDGSDLLCTASSKDSSSVDEYMDQIKNDLLGDVSEGQLLRNNTDDGILVVTGYQGSDVLYEVVNVSRDEVMRMRILTPDGTSYTDRLHKNYVTECMFRLCGFSNSGKSTRSYDEFVDSLKK